MFLFSVSAALPTGRRRREPGGDRLLLVVKVLLMIRPLWGGMQGVVGFSYDLLQSSRRGVPDGDLLRSITVLL